MGEKSKKHSTYHDYVKGGGKVFFFPPENNKIDSDDIYSKKKELVPHDRKMR